MSAAPHFSNLTTPGGLLALIGSLLGLTLAGILAAHPLARWSPPEPLVPDIPRIKASAPEGEAGTGMSALLATPPFWASRRPETPAPTQDGPKEEEPETLPKDTLLLGLYGSGPDAGALIRIGGETKRIPLGGKIFGWTVNDIQPGRVVLTTPRGQRKEIPLLHAKPTAAPPLSKPRPPANGDRPAERRTGARTSDTQHPARATPKP